MSAKALNRPRTPLQLARAQGKVERLDSPIEALFAQQLRAYKAPAHERNYRGAIPGRELEMDFAFVPIRLGIEVQGRVHCIFENLQRDTEKHALALLAGWLVLPVTGRQIRDGRAIQWAMDLITQRTTAMERNA